MSKPSPEARRAFIHKMIGQESTILPRPCPYCGRTNIQVCFTGVYDRFHLMCQWCGSTGPEGKVRTKDSAIHAWNGDAESIFVNSWTEKYGEKE